MIEPYAIGLDLGGSSIKGVAVGFDGNLLQRENFEFDPDRPRNWAERSLQLVKFLEGEREAKPTIIGVSAPGLAARDGLSISYMPGRLQGLEGFNWTQFLAHPLPVPVLNDAHAALLGEVWVGAARDQQNVIMLTLGTGVGGAALVDGRLLKGEIGRGGHLGHNCLDPEGPRDVTGIPGSIEVLIGNCTIAERTGNRFATTHELIQAFEKGDSAAADIWLQSLKALACTIATYINVFDPGCVIIGGGIARAGESLFGPLEKFVRDVEWQPGGHQVPILPAQLGELAGAFGAAWNAIKQVPPGF